jgi:hypothetical protein
MHVDLPKGRSAEILEAEEMPHGVRVEVGKLAPAWDPNATAEDNARRYTPAIIVRMRDTMLAHVITGWSFGEPPAGNADALRVVPEPAYDALVEATADHWEVLGFSRPETKTEETDPTPEQSSSSE